MNLLQCDFDQVWIDLFDSLLLWPFLSILLALFLTGLGIYIVYLTWFDCRQAEQHIRNSKP